MFTRPSYDRDVYDQSWKSKIQTYNTDENIYYNNDVCLPNNDKAAPFNPVLFGNIVDVDSELRGITRKISKDIRLNDPFKNELPVFNNVPKNCDDTVKSSFTRLEEYHLNTGIILDRNATSFTSQSDIDFMELKYNPRSKNYGLNTRLLYRDNFKSKKM